MLYIYLYIYIAAVIITLYILKNSKQYLRKSIFLFIFSYCLYFVRNWGNVKKNKFTLNCSHFQEYKNWIQKSSTKLFIDFARCVKRNSKDISIITNVTIDLRNFFFFFQENGFNFLMFYCIISLSWRNKIYLLGIICDKNYFSSNLKRK